MTTVQRVIKYCALAFAVLLVVTIIGGIIAVISGISGFFRDDDSVMAGERKVYAVSQDIRVLELEIGAAELRIEIGDRLQVESNLKRLEVRESGGKLLVLEKKHFGGGNYNNVTVTLTIPQGFCFQKASITTGAGRVYIESLEADALEMELGAGEVVVDHLQARIEADVESGAGKVTISSGYLQDLDLEMGIGQLNLTASLVGKCSIEQGIGEANLDLVGPKDHYCLSVKKGVGDIRIDGQSVGNGYTYGDGQHKVTVQGGVGSINIRFREA